MEHLNINGIVIIPIRFYFYSSLSCRHYGRSTKTHFCGTRAKEKENSTDKTDGNNPSRKQIQIDLFHYLKKLN